MFCKHCGNQVADDSVFCSHCGTRLIEDAAPAPAVSAPAEEIPAEPEPEVAAPAIEEPVQQAAPAVPAAAASAQAPAAKAPAAAAQEPEAPRKPFLEGMSFDVSEYPDSRVVEKTDDIDFNWNLDPDDVPELRAKLAQAKAQVPEPKKEPKKDPETSRVAEIFDRVVPAQEARNAIPADAASEAAGKVGQVAQLNTFNQKNAEFQKLLDKELAKVRDAGPSARNRLRPTRRHPSGSSPVKRK